jgi:hypothetical protein
MNADEALHTFTTGGKVHDDPPHEEDGGVVIDVQERDLVVVAAQGHDDLDQQQGGEGKKEIQGQEGKKKQTKCNQIYTNLDKKGGDKKCAYKEIYIVKRR